MLLESANLAQEEVAMQVPGSGRKPLLSATPGGPYPKDAGLKKSLVQLIWLRPGSLPWLRAATAGTGSSVMLCKACKGLASRPKTDSPETGVKITTHLLTVNTKVLREKHSNGILI